MSPQSHNSGCSRSILRLPHGVHALLHLEVSSMLTVLRPLKQFISIKHKYN